MSKVAIVTGSNKGIGYGIVKNLCEKFQGIVYLTARDVTRGKNAVESLNKLGLKPEFHQLDVNDKKSILTFAEFLKEKHGGIDVLVNNAGICFFPNDDPDLPPFEVQVKETLRTNYFALMDVCDALFPLLRPHARIVTLSSSAGHLLRIPGEDLRKKFANPDLQLTELTQLIKDFIESTKQGNHLERGWPERPYPVSKVGASALTRIYHREFLKDSREDIVINHVHPGFVDTDMTHHKGPLTVEEGSDAATYLALLPEGITSPRGDYIWYDRQIVDWVSGPTPSKH